MERLGIAHLGSYELMSAKGAVVDVMNELDPVLFGTGVQWSDYCQGRLVLERAEFILRSINEAAIRRRIMHLESLMKMETSEAGWKAYLEIELLLREAGVSRGCSG